ncbi:putative HLH transcription factor [Aspergillus egyptiacus]|nr:putative HLH transcription factor [Aspergillus egyptiacus]
MMSINTSNGAEGQHGRKNPAGPFGYSFPQDTPYEPAPTSPLGEPLLNDNETNMLDTFFTTMNSNPFANDFWYTGAQNDSNKSQGLPSLDWPNELPPTFEGSTTSLPHQSFLRGAEKPLSVIPEHSNTNSDVVAAASMLYQNGINGPEISTAFGGQPFSAFSNNDYPSIKGNNGKGRTQNGHSPFKRPSTSPRTHLPVGFHTSQMFFDVHEPISPEQQLSTKIRPLHWGSDSSFMDQGYVAPPDQPDEEQQTKKLLDNLECLEPQSSAANTRAPTPDRIVHHHAVPWVDSSSVNHLDGNRKDYGNSTEDLSRPRKKQRLSIKEEDDELSDGDGPRQPSKRAKGRRLSNDASRKSKSSQGSKAPRENLTEEQKRSNHILSEQKRRNLIRQGFEDLCTLVPGLKGGGFSKSAMLTQAADWLEDILRGNEMLKAQLAELKTMDGLVIPQ